MDFIQKGKEYDMIGLGEVMLRLSPQNTDKISQSHIFEKNAGGSEFNVMSGAAMLGVRTALITKLPENKLGHYIRNMIRYGDVSDDHIVYDTSPEARLGVYYYEQGAYPRKASVIYDRAVPPSPPCPLTRLIRISAAGPRSFMSAAFPWP